MNFEASKSQKLTGTQGGGEASSRRHQLDTRQGGMRIRSVIDNRDKIPRNLRDLSPGCSAHN
jgi:hypothetical protein